MIEQDNFNLDHQLIREALQKEFDSVETPSPFGKWQRIESRLNEQPERRSLQDYSWSRWAVVAAVFLVVILGGIGFFRSIQLATPLADSEAPSDVNEEFLIMEEDDNRSEAIMAVEDDAEIPIEESVSIMEEDAGSGDGDQADFGEVASTVSDWPLLLAEEYRLYNTIILDERDGIKSEGAIYRSGSNEFMLIKTKITGQSLNQYLQYISELIGVDLELIGDLDHYLQFTVFEMPGLAWQNDRFDQALFVVSGNLEVADLEVIAAEIEEII